MSGVTGQPWAGLLPGRVLLHQPFLQNGPPAAAAACCQHHCWHAHPPHVLRMCCAAVFDRSVVVSNGFIHEQLLSKMEPCTAKLVENGINLSQWYVPSVSDYFPLAAPQLRGAREPLSALWALAAL